MFFLSSGLLLFFSDFRQYVNHGAELCVHPLYLHSAVNHREGLCFRHVGLMGPLTLTSCLAAVASPSSLSYVGGTFGKQSVQYF